MAVAVDAALAERLDNELEADLRRNGRLGRVRRYLAGDHDLPYMPRGAKREYRHLARRAITNWTPLLSDTYAKGLFVDGYRSDRSGNDEDVWRFWQVNGMDARQSIAHRGALEYGTSYTLVLPGSVQSGRVPYWRPLSPLRTLAYFKDEDAEFPEVFFRRLGQTVDGARLVEVYNAEKRFTFALPKDRGTGWVLSGEDEHGLGETPAVRFRDRLDGEAVGIIRPVLTLQDRVNEIVFSTLIALQYASFRQRWATGLAIPEDDDGNAVEPFESAVDRLWVTDDPNARFGDFAQTELSGHLSAYDSTVRTLAAVSQISPNILTGDLVNLSADALAQMEASTQRKMSEYETLFGESWESGFRLAARAGGVTLAQGADLAQVRWRDTEARSLSQTVDALGKIAQMLQVPVEALWERIPGVTDEDVAYWRTLREESDVVGEILGTLGRQSALPAPSAPGASAPSAAEIAATTA